MNCADSSALSRTTFWPAPFLTLSEAFAIWVGEPLRPMLLSSTSFSSSLPQTVTSFASASTIPPGVM